MNRKQALQSVRFEIGNIKKARYVGACILIVLFLIISILKEHWEWAVACGSLLAVPLIILFLDWIKNKLFETKKNSHQGLNDMLKKCSTTNGPNPLISKIVREKSESNLFLCGEVKIGDYDLVDFTRLISETSNGKCFFKISMDNEYLNYYISDSPNDKAVYMYSQHPFLREGFPGVKPEQTDPGFHPWKVYDTLEVFVDSCIRTCLAFKKQKQMEHGTKDAFCPIIILAPPLVKNSYMRVFSRK